MRQHKFLDLGMKAHPEHGHQGQCCTGHEDQVQGEHIAQYTVNHRRESCAAHRSGLNKPQNSPPVLFRQSQNQRCIEHRVSRAVQEKSDEAEKNNS